MPDAPAPALFVYHSPQYSWRHYLAYRLNGQMQFLEGPYRYPSKCDAAMRHWRWNGEKFERVQPEAVTKLPEGWHIVDEKPEGE